MKALKKKLEANLNDRLKLRETEHNKLLQRYQNVKKEIENQQNIERIKFEKAFQNSNTRPQTGKSMMGSRMQASTMMNNRKGSKQVSNNQYNNPASKPSHF